MGETLSEDWYGTYWWQRSDPRWRERGLSRSIVYAARCRNPECLWSVVIECRADGWWWAHDDETSGPEEHGPHEHWQEAARAAVEADVAAPVR